jgi:hypothetical protein
MADRIIDATHRIREQHYEETKDLPLEEWLERIHQGAERFQKLIDCARQERKSGIEE